MTIQNEYLDCGDIYIHYEYLYPETRELFKNSLTKLNEYSQSIEIKLTPKYLEKNRWLVDENEKSSSFLEFQCLMLKTGNELLEHKKALFHGAALLWKEKAWIITAPSGTGKTTQLRYWRKILNKDVVTINGDKPLLECKDNGTVFVYSSPWKGKEKYGLDGRSAQLGGIILLEQGKENKIERLEPKEAVLPLFHEFVSFPENNSQIQAQSEILNHIIEAVPVWKLTNIGDEESARLTINTVDSDLWIQRGISLTEVQGIYLLVADEEGRKHCPYVKEINEVSAFIWKQLVKHKSINEICTMLKDEYEIPESFDVETDVTKFLQLLHLHHYVHRGTDL